MKTPLHCCINTILFSLFFTLNGITQNGLFESDSILNITLSGNLNELMSDRSDNAKYHPVNILYKDKDSADILLRTEIKTRGHFRKLKANCLYPPLLIQFQKSDTLKSSTFNKYNQLKLVMPCRSDEYVVHEWLVYKLYNLITPESFRARLVKVKLDDKQAKKTPAPFYGILLENEKQMAARNGLVLVNKQMKPQQMEPGAFLKMAVFEYLIGNTDWSVQYLQNIRLLATDSTAVPVAVPYDFDHAGIVDAPYALPAEELEMSSVRERRYRGYCIENMDRFKDVIALYNQLKDSIYAVYNNCSLLNAKYLKATLKYLDQFYATINNINALKKEFQYPCNVNGTGNIIIKGMKD